MSFEPWINWQFHKAPRWIDPRASFVRASVARAPNRLGVLSAVPANVARFQFNPVTRLCEGLLVEPQRTNLLLRSEELDNAAWTATGLTVAANAATAPDGTTTADNLVVTALNGSLAQAVTITAGRGIGYSFHARANASGFVLLQLSDGTNAVQCWYNLAAGTVGTNTAGAATCVFSQKSIEDLGGGIYRCGLEVVTNTSTVFVATISPAAADNAAPAVGNSCYAWGGQFEADAALTNVTSYIPTAGASATRSADNLILPVTTAQVPLDRGTMVFEFTQRLIPPVNGGQSVVLGGIGNASGFTDFLYVSRSGATSVGATYSSTNNPGTPTIPNKTIAFVPGQIYRVGVSWSANRVAITVDGAAITAGSANIVPMTQVGRIAVGCAPWSASSASTLSNVVHRAFQYAPHTVTDAVLQQLTAP